MRISINWLSRLVDLKGLTPEQIQDDLTMSTCEIEGREVFGAGLDEIVVGHVVECERHPDADKLSVTKVDVGAGELLNIVCGASNVAADQKVAVITPGKTLPGGMKVKKAKIRGVESLGMICSERELGLSEEHEGIMELHPGLKPGLAFDKVVPVVDHILELDNKSVNHRPDLWGHYGLARELAAIYGRELKPAYTPQEFPADGASVEISIEDLQDCPRFCGLVIDGVEAKRSPDWMRYLLLAVGQRPIDLLVDLTNFITHEFGQPMHAFDMRQLDPSGIRVRRANAGESLQTLDGMDRELSGEDIVVASGNRAVSIAGIMGGQGTMVGADTTTMFIESANWHPARVRRTSTRLGLRTDASTRFEKSLDPAGAEASIHRYLELLRGECPDARAAGPMKDPANWRYEDKHVTLRRSRLAMKLGVSIADAEVSGTLEALQFDVSKTDDGFDIGIPSFRGTKDISIEDDLIEEVGRMYRYDKIPEQPLLGRCEPPAQDEGLSLARQIIKIAATQGGCHEVMSYSFIGDAQLAAVDAEDHEYARVSNPVAPEMTRMRRHVLPSLLSRVVSNLHQVAELRLVEHGKGYHPEHRDEHGLPHEVHEIAFVWSRREGADPYFELRSHIEAVLGRTGFAAQLDEKLGLDKEQPWTHPGKTVAIVCDGAISGFVGYLHPAVAHRLGIPASTAIACLNLCKLLAAPRRGDRFSEIPRFPSQPVDVALLVPTATRAGEVAAFLAATGKKLVRSVDLFEVYQGEGVADGLKSLNFTVTLGAQDRTLTAKDEEKYLSKVRENCGRVGAELRG